MELILKNINKSYGDNKVLSDINLHIKGGELMSVIGPSGVGKTTILNIIAGLVDIDSGSIVLNGEDITNTPPEKRGISYIFQSPLLFPHMNVWENICFGLDIRKESKAYKEETVNRLLVSLGIKELSKRMPYELSGGQQQRVAIARALAVKPCLLLMDEPFSSLDPELRSSMGKLIKEVQREYSQTILFVTHDRNESMMLSDRLSVLLGGRINQTGTPDDVYYRPCTKDIGEFMGSSNFFAGDALLKLSKQFCGIENESGQTLFLRPHQIKIKRTGSGYVIKDKAFIGKEIRYTVTDGEVEIIIDEYSSNPLNIGDSIGIRIQSENLHYIKVV